MTRTAVALLAALILVPASTVSAADNLTGAASIFDGDTLLIGGMRIRLWGVDAPESSQLCRGEDSLQYEGGPRTRNLHYQPTGELQPDILGPLRALGDNMYGEQ